MIGDEVFNFCLFRRIFLRRFLRCLFCFDWILFFWGPRFGFLIFSSGNLLLRVQNGFGLFLLREGWLRKENRRFFLRGMTGASLVIGHMWAITKRAFRRLLFIYRAFGNPFMIFRTSNAFSRCVATVRGICDFAPGQGFCAESLLLRRYPQWIMS